MKPQRPESLLSRFMASERTAWVFGMLAVFTMGFSIFKVVTSDVPSLSELGRRNLELRRTVYADLEHGARRQDSIFALTTEIHHMMDSLSNDSMSSLQALRLLKRIDSVSSRVTDLNELIGKIRQSIHPDDNEEAFKYLRIGDRLELLGSNFEKRIDSLRTRYDAAQDRMDVVSDYQEKRITTVHTMFWSLMIAIAVLAFFLLRLTVTRSLDATPPNKTTTN